MTDWWASIDPGTGLPSWLLVLAPGWPLLLALLLVPPGLRSGARWLAPWAALPALLLAAAGPQATLPLPGVLLGATLRLDAPGRWVLGAVALLWLVGGWLAADRRCPPRTLLALLLAMAGAFWLPLAGDLPSLLAASVLAAYPLYGLLAARGAGVVFIISIVIADLLLLEAVLLLLRDADPLDFASLRAGWTGLYERDLLLLLLLLGLGVRAGLTGVHYWLAPALVQARDWLLGPVVAFTLAAGLLPALRLLPLGLVDWPAVAAAMQVMALLGGGWSVLAGLLQGSPRAVVAYAATALTMLWLALAGLQLQGATAVPDAVMVLPVLAALAGLGVAALLLASVAAPRSAAGMRGVLVPIALLLVGEAVLGTAPLTAQLGEGLHWPTLTGVAFVGLLLGAAIGAMARSDRAVGLPEGPRVAAALAAGGALLAALALATLQAKLPWVQQGAGRAALAVLSVLVTAMLIGRLLSPGLARLPRVPAGDLLPLIERGVTAGLGAWAQGGVLAARLRNGVYRATGRAKAMLLRLPWIAAAESAETRCKGAARAHRLGS
jgi:hypothetical protein